MLMLTGCRDYEADALIDGHVRVPVAYAFSSAMAGGQTRQADAALDGARRDVSILSIIPLKNNVPDGSEVSQPEEPVDKPDSNPTAKFYHYKFCNMTTGVNRCLVYGKAAEVSGGKGENGSLTVSNLPTQTVPSEEEPLNDISFGLESIYHSEDVPDEATALANQLNAIFAEVPAWQTSTHPVLRNLFINFTSHGLNLPGSAASVKQWMLALKTAAQSYIDSRPSTISDTEVGILTAITNYITDEKLAEISGTYPRDKGLPDGAAALRWVESEGKFVPQLQTTTLDNINSVSRFAYPAALYYFVNSTLRTSGRKVDFDEAYEQKNNWTDVLSAYFSDADAEVSPNTKAVALTNPVQYAVAQLKVNLKAQSLTLPCEGGSVTFDGDDFLLRGIIVCGQRPVDYQFAQTSNSDVDVKFIYDPLGTYCYLSTTEPQEAVAHTLVLQSHDGEDVDIILEFENKSGQSFKCVDGTVYPDTRFYLIGKVAWTENPAGTKDDNNKDRVFTKDYITTVNMTVTSLAKAYNVLPNLLTSNLEIGVATTPQWVAATPTTIRLDDK